MSEQKRLTEYSKAFGYTATPENWIDLETEIADPATAYLYRRAKDAGASHAYVFRTCPPDMPILPARPAVFVASAKNGGEADEIHRKMYLLGNAPFIVVVLPEQVRVYTGFNYPQYENQSQNRFIIQQPALDEHPTTIAAVRDALNSFNADEIDSGRIWERQSPRLKAANRIDQRLLRSLQQLGDKLVSVEYGLSKETAHNLIGKYIYIRFLKDRKILSSEWLEQRDLSLSNVLGRAATVNGLRQLVTALEDRFNGGVFPLLFEGPQAPNDAAVRYVASIFAGDEPNGQLEFDFYVYDFAFIPIELLSSIYEQFLRRESEASKEVEKVGAYYTPEPVADYLVSELNYVKPLQIGMRVLDPCCGSGIFLVLAYRRLIEMKKAQHKAEKRPELSPHDLKNILTTSIYGVERNKSACYVSEFSLILTLLSYVAPPQLHRYEDFKFPDLHNKQIFECDFFNDHSSFWQESLRFDWIIGNTPWVQLPKKSKSEYDPDLYVRRWLQSEKATKHLVNSRVSDAFCWRVTKVLGIDGCIGLFIPAKSLTNESCTRFRKTFFAQHLVYRITNFANLAYVLFAGRAEHPAATIIYKHKETQSSIAIVHFGPFGINQVPERTSGTSNDQLWTITIHEAEIRFISPEDAQKGDGRVWKMALWGNHRDTKVLSRLQRLFPTTVKQLCKDRKWDFRMGLQLRETSPNEETIALPELAALKLLSPQKMTASGFHFSVPMQVMESIPDDKLNVRKIGGKIGLKTIHAPHIYLKIDIAAYSDIDFVLPDPQIGVASSTKDAEYLRAFSMFLSSSIFRYLLFFQSSEWGISTNTVGIREIAHVHVPALTDKQVEELAALHRELSEEETANALSKNKQTRLFVEGSGANSTVPEHVSRILQKRLDDRVENILNLPSSMQIIVRDFMEYRYQFNKGKRAGTAANQPDDDQLLIYGRTLAHSLDAFIDSDSQKHEIKLARLGEVIMCQVALVQSSAPVGPTILEVEEQNASDLQGLWQSLKQRFSQWVYIQRSLRIFDGTNVQLFKSARLIDWTRTQALLDSDDVIGELLSHRVGVK